MKPGGADLRKRRLFPEVVQVHVTEAGIAQLENPPADSGDRNLDIFAPIV